MTRRRTKVEKAQQRAAARAYRMRLEAGRSIARIEHELDDTAFVLVKEGYLDPKKVDNRAAVDEALGRFWRDHVAAKLKTSEA